MQKISKDKKYRTRDGREVEILYVNEKLLVPVGAIIGEDNANSAYWID